MVKQKQGVGLIGLGNWGKVLRSKLESHGLKWAISGRNPREYKSMLKETNWVFVATPTQTHAVFVRASLKAGANVFCEKPFNVNRALSQELYDLAAKNGLKLYVNDVFTWEGQVRKAGVQSNVKKLNFEWKKWGTFKDNIWSALVYHDLTILDSVLGGLNSFEVVSCRLNEYNRKEILALANGLKTRLIYDRTQDKSIRPSKKVLVNGKVLYDSKNKQDDPLNEMIDAVLIGKADFEKNKKRTLMVEGILESLASKYEAGMTPVYLDDVKKTNYVAGI